MLRFSWRKEGSSVVPYHGSSSNMGASSRLAGDGVVPGVSGELAHVYACMACYAYAFLDGCTPARGFSRAIFRVLYFVTRNTGHHAPVDSSSLFPHFGRNRDGPQTPVRRERESVPRARKVCHRGGILATAQGSFALPWVHFFSGGW